MQVADQLMMEIGLKINFKEKEFYIMIHQNLKMLIIEI